MTSRDLAPPNQDTDVGTAAITALSPSAAAQPRAESNSDMDSASARAYLEQFAVQESITQALGHVIEKRPANPVKELGKFLVDAEEKREEAKMLQEIAVMSGPEGFDFIIVCCSNLAAGVRFWLARTLPGSIFEAKMR